MRHRPRGEHWVCRTCDAVITGPRCPARGHWLEVLIGRGRAHRVTKCDGDCLADRVGFEAARNVTLRYSLGLWTNDDLLERLDVLKARLAVLDALGAR